MLGLRRKTVSQAFCNFLLRIERSGWICFLVPGRDVEFFVERRVLGSCVRVSVVHCWCIRGGLGEADFAVRVF
jgi:hypothetical protein